MSQPLLPCAVFSESIKAWMASVTNSTDSKSLNKWAQTTENRDALSLFFHPWRGPGMRCDSYRINLLRHQEEQLILATSVCSSTSAFFLYHNKK